MTGTSPRTGRARDLTTALCVGALIALPALLLAMDNYWLYSHVGWLDPWIYSGYHMYISYMLRHFPNAYYGTREPWTVIGWIVHRIAGPEVSLYILALLLFYTATLSLYFAIAQLFKSRIAALAAACVLGTNSWFLASIGWNYIDGPMIALILASIAALIATAQGRSWRTAAVAWGAATAATITLFSPNVDLLPIYSVMYVTLNSLGLRRPLVTVALMWCLGFSLTVLFLCCVNWILGGPFFFFVAQFGTALSLYSMRETWEASLDKWIWAAPWLLVQAFAFLASFTVIALRWKLLFAYLSGRERSGIPVAELRLLILAGACVVATAGFIAMELLHFGMLLWFYHANELLPFDALVFGGCLGFALARLPARAALSFGIAAPLLCLAPWFASWAGWLRVPLPYNTISEPVLFAGWITEPLWMLVGAALIVSVVFVRGWAFPVAMIAFLAFVSVLTIPVYTTVAPNASARDNALAIYDVASVLDAHQSANAFLFYWSPKDVNQNLYTSLSVMYNASRTTAAPPPGVRVVVLSSGGDVASIEGELLKNTSLSLKPVARDHIRHGSVVVEFAVEDLVRSSASRLMPIVRKTVAKRAAGL